VGFEAQVCLGVCAEESEVFLERLAGEPGLPFGRRDPALEAEVLGEREGEGRGVELAHAAAESALLPTKA